MSARVLGVLLAGGLARRMGGGDKCLKMLSGKTLLATAIERASGQVDVLVLNASGDPARFSGFGLPVVADVIENYAGPLAGVLTAMEWAAGNMADVEWVATFATDAPFFPMDMVARLMAEIETSGAEMACATSNGRSHPVFALWPVRLATDLRRAMIDEEMRKIDRWTARYKLAQVDFPLDPVDPFTNINTPEDLSMAERIIEQQS